MKKYGVQEWVDLNKFFVNPFIYEGKTVGIVSMFKEMSTQTDGVFNNGSAIYVVSNIPKGLLTSQCAVVVAGNVIGKTQLNTAAIGTGSVPHMKFAGIYICQDQNCTEFLGKRNPN